MRCMAQNATRISWELNTAHTHCIWPVECLFVALSCTQSYIHLLQGIYLPYLLLWLGRTTDVWKWPCQRMESWRQMLAECGSVSVLWGRSDIICVSEEKQKCHPVLRPRQIAVAAWKRIVKMSSYSILQCRKYEQASSDNKNDALKGFTLSANRKDWWHEHEDGVSSAFFFLSFLPSLYISHMSKRCQRKVFLCPTVGST